MTQLSRVAILVNEDAKLTFELADLIYAFNKISVEAKLFYDSESILAYQPDFVIITSPQDAKLTPYPTYGLINRARDEYLEIPRFLRNILTYDGYFTISPRLKQMLRDLMFGARKLGTAIEFFDFFPPETKFNPPVITGNELPVIIFEPDYNNSIFKKAILYLLDKMTNISVVTFCLPATNKHSRRFIQASDSQELNQLLHKHAIAICLYSGDQQEETLQPAVLKIVASCAVTIAQRSKLLAEYFGDNIYYIPQDTYLRSLPDVIRAHINAIHQYPDIALQRCQQAHQIFLNQFCLDVLLPKISEFHQRALISKGYTPQSDQIEKTLPSVSYIMRTGGTRRHFLERALNCLVAQQYPDLRVIFVTHIHVPYLHAMMAQQYPMLKYKIIESISSQRSQAIRDGMEAVDTDLFGLFDDDDELFPNHVRTLVKTLQYHANRDWRGEIGMVYSGSIHADDTYPVFERVEYQDHKLVNKNEKRAIEHFKFYSSLLMSQHAWFMPNGWLARSKFIDDELLTDPGLDTCEDLYFELQIAQKAQFAFSAEVTAVHHFHHLGNSTIDDNYKHLPDTQRIALRNFSRVFPTDMLYDTSYNIIGRLSQHDPNQIRYQDFRPVKQPVMQCHPFYPFRNYSPIIAAPVLDNRLNIKFFRLLMSVPLKFFKFIKLGKYKRHYYLNKFKLSVNQYGYIVTLKRMVIFFNK